MDFIIELLKWVCVGVVFALGGAILVLVWIFRPDEIDPEDCDCTSKRYDDGHPDYPWVCDDCGERFK